MIDRNPYEAPRAEIEYVGRLPKNLFEMRGTYLVRENLIRAVGAVTLGCAAGFAIADAAFVAYGVLQHVGHEGAQEAALVAIGTALGALAGLGAYAGLKVWCLDRKGRYIITGAASAVTVAFCATAISGVVILSLAWGGAVIFIFWSKKSRTIFSDYYKHRVIPASPGTNYVVGTILWVAAILVAIVLSLVVLRAATGD